jgi:hypothetical protein
MEPQDQRKKTILIKSITKWEKTKLAFRYGGTEKEDHFMRGGSFPKSRIIHLAS